MTINPAAFAQLHREYREAAVALRTLNRSDFEHALAEHPELELALREQMNRPVSRTKRDRLTKAIAATFPRCEERIDLVVRMESTEAIIAMIERGEMSCDYDADGQVVLRKVAT